MNYRHLRHRNRKTAFWAGCGFALASVTAISVFADPVSGGRSDSFAELEQIREDLGPSAQRRLDAIRSEIAQAGQASDRDRGWRKMRALLEEVRFPQGCYSRVIEDEVPGGRRYLGTENNTFCSVAPHSFSPRALLDARRQLQDSEHAGDYRRFSGLMSSLSSKILQAHPRARLADESLAEGFGFPSPQYGGTAVGICRAQIRDGLSVRGEGVGQRMASVHLREAGKAVGRLMHSSSLPDEVQNQWRQSFGFQDRHFSEEASRGQDEPVLKPEILQALFDDETPWFSLEERQRAQARRQQFLAAVRRLPQETGCLNGARSPNPEVRARCYEMERAKAQIEGSFEELYRSGRDQPSRAQMQRCLARFRRGQGGEPEHTLSAVSSSHPLSRVEREAEREIARARRYVETPERSHQGTAPVVNHAIESEAESEESGQAQSASQGQEGSSSP